MGYFWVKDVEILWIKTLFSKYLNHSYVIGPIINVNFFQRLPNYVSICQEQQEAPLILEKQMMTQVHSIQKLNFSDDDAFITRGLLKLVPILQSF